MKILILASNPRKDLNLDDEIRLLRSVIDQSRDRDHFEVVSEPGVRVGDLQRLLLRHKPEIVHFCGHGGGEEGLIFKLDGGGEQRVRADALADMFGLNPICSHVKCVLLNACYSEKQADAIISRIHYVVGMSHEIQDNAAIAFSKGFYLGLGYGCSIDEAFEFGRNAIQLEISGSSKMRSAATEEGVRKAEVVNAIQQTAIPEHLKPILKRNPTLAQAASPVISSSKQPLSQTKREEIQLGVAKVLTEEELGVKQFRDQVRDFLKDHKLADYEKDLLNAFREELGLSTGEADRILEEEQEPLRQARQSYVKRLVTLTKYYPFDEAIKAELKKFQSQRNLTNEEVDEISQPIFEKAEADYQEKLKQRERQEYEQKLQRYEQAFREKIEAQYPLDSSVLDELRAVQQSLELSDADVARIGVLIVAPKEAKYQQRLAEEQHIQVEAERQQLEKNESNNLLPNDQEPYLSYVEAFSRETKREYPLSAKTRKALKKYQQTLLISDEEVILLEKKVLSSQQDSPQNREQVIQADKTVEQHVSNVRTRSKDLQSDQGVNYTRLQDLLIAGKWKEANDETRELVIQLGRRQRQGYLRAADIKNLPCADLQTIDQLWMKHSKGRFGFSVQKKIFKESDGNLNSDDYAKVFAIYQAENWFEFCKHVRWVKNKFLLVPFFVDESELIFDISAPPGHLPHPGVLQNEVYMEDFGKKDKPFRWSFLIFCRLNTCKLEHRQRL